MSESTKTTAPFWKWWLPRKPLLFLTTSFFPTAREEQKLVVKNNNRSVGWVSRARRLNAFFGGGCGLLVRFRGLVCLVCRGAVLLLWWYGAAVLPCCCRGVPLSVLPWCCGVVVVAAVVVVASAVITPTVRTESPWATNPVNCDQLLW